MWMHSTGIGTTPPVQNTSEAFLRSPFVQVKNLDDMLVASSPFVRYLKRKRKVYRKESRTEQSVGSPYF